MLGLGLLVRAGRSLIAGPVADAGWLPGSYYRHLVLEALEEDDFPGALNYLQWTDDPILAQMLILRLRLLIREHQQQRESILGLAGNGLPAERKETCRDLLDKQDRALALLRGYEARALALVRRPGTSPG